MVRWFSKAIFFTFTFTFSFLWALSSIVSAAPPVAGTSINNTASVGYAIGSVNQPSVSGSASFVVGPAPSPAKITFWRYAPNDPNAVLRNYDGGSYRNAAGESTPLPNTLTMGGNPIPSGSIPVVETETYHAGDAVFVRLVDLNRNENPLAVEFIEATVGTSLGDSELVTFRETGIDTGEFTAKLQGVDVVPPVKGKAGRANKAVRSAPSLGDGILALDDGANVDAGYCDPGYLSDCTEDIALVDPAGIVFNSTTGAPVNGATVELMSLSCDSNIPAQVFGDSGIGEPFPSTVVTGTGTTTSVSVYTFAPGEYRFPLVAQGTYCLKVTPPGGFVPGGYVVPSQKTIAVVSAPYPGGILYRIDPTGSFSGVFTVSSAPALIDIPIDPVPGSLFLTKTVSTTEASAGDFLQYRLAVNNVSVSNPVTGVVITDTLPVGMRYKGGSLRVNGVVIADPPISADGRTLTIGIPGGVIASGGNAKVSYVVYLGSDIPAGDAVNEAVGTGTDGAIGVTSNVARATVRIREPFMGNHFTIVGRVVSGDCDQLWGKLVGVGRVRILMEDGTSVLTDKDGLYHFKGVHAGSHVVQLDFASLPDGYEVVPCIQNSRFAGRSFSQFVDAHGGALWRADFYVRPKRVLVPKAEPVRVEHAVGILLKSRLRPGTAPMIPLESPLAPEKIVSSPLSKYELRVHFDTLKAILKPEGRREVSKLVTTLKRKEIDRIEVIGNTDIRIIHHDGLKIFANNYLLSEARAKAVADRLIAELGLPANRFEISGVGPDRPIASNKTAAGMTLNRRTDVIVHWREAGESKEKGIVVPPKVSVEGPTESQLEVQVVLDGGPISIASLRLGVSLPTGAIFKAGSVLVNGNPFPDPALVEGKLVFSLGAQGGILGQATGWKSVVEFGATISGACEADGYKMRAQAGFESTEAGNTVQEYKTPIVDNQLTCLNKPVQQHSQLENRLYEILRQGKALFASIIMSQFISTAYAADDLRLIETQSERKTVTFFTTDQPTEVKPVEAISPIAITEEALPAGGVVVTPSRLAFVPELSTLVADGLRAPLIAIRAFDQAGKPLQAGSVVSVTVDSPYILAQEVLWQQRRQLAATDSFKSFYAVKGNDGIVMIALSPTTAAGVAVLRFVVPSGLAPEIGVPLSVALREFVVVGFAEGTVGYNTLKGNMQTLNGRVEDNLYTDGKLAFYAKGRVQGKWLLTMAYDSKKEKSHRRESLLSTIDPNQFYTLYGDGTEQTYDASSQYRLYLKLERDQFYALLGDFETGLSETELSRYSRTLSGVKSVYNGGVVSAVIFASETAQRFVKDEIQGDGTSGLYRLSRSGMVINSERIRIETRDRFHSERILSTQNLSRHIDYEVDYAGGTLFFKSPVQSRDTNFNPIFIVAEYETIGVSSKDLNAGGRVAVKLFNGALTTGLSAIHDESIFGRTELFGVDAKLKFAGSQLRIEGAGSEGETSNVDQKGSAYLVEMGHKIGPVDLLAYSRRISRQFGVGQQGAAEQGMLKSGIDGNLKLSDTVSLQGQVYQQENLTSTAMRQVESLTLQQKGENGGLRVGLLSAVDEQKTSKLQSQQIQLGANRFFWNKAIEVNAGVDASISQNESVDFPTRYTVGAAYAITDETRLIVNHEYTDGQTLDTQMTRIGLQTAPWKGARLTSTVNQQGVSEHGPRTFAQMGLTQSLIINDKWGVDFSVDSSRTFKESGTPTIINLKQPIASGTLTDDFTAVTAGATYRTDLWSISSRAESRSGQTSDRIGLTTNFVRQIKAGIALSAGMQVFETKQISGTEGVYANANLGWAYRPLESSWSILDKLEFKWDEVKNGSGLLGSSPFGFNNLTANGDAKSRRMINHFNLNRVSKRWDVSGDKKLVLNERNQWSVYYGAKYVFDQFDATDYKGYTDLLGLEWRYDLRPFSRWVDLGLQTSVLHVWELKNYSYSVGPSIGISAFDNGWITLGYNVLGFRDRDFSAANYTAQGPYIKLRIKFDQQTGRNE